VLETLHEQHQEQVRRHVPLVKLVEHHHPEPAPSLPPEQAPQQHALGHVPEPRVPARLLLEAHAVANAAAELAAELARDETRREPRRQPPRLGHPDLLAFCQRGLEQRTRHARGLAGARRRLDHHGTRRLERPHEWLEQLVDGQRAIRRHPRCVTRMGRYHKGFPRTGWPESKRGHAERSKRR
jgi:hypothetical protein